MRKSDFVGALAFAVAIPGWAQDPPPTFDDLKNSLGDLQKKQEQDDNAARESAIHRNYEDTLKIYGNTLGGGKSGDLANVGRRLEVNQALEAKYAKLLEKAQGDLATMRAQYINRTMNLKKSLDEGKLSRDAYDKLLTDDTKRFRNREREIIEDMAFFNEEISNARKLNKDLGLKKELLQFDPFDPDKKEEPATAVRKDGLAENLKKTVSELSGYKPRSVLDYLK